MSVMTSIYVSTATVAAKHASLIASSTAATITVFTAPLADWLFPGELNEGERQWLFERELREFREVMEQAKKDLERIEELYGPMFRLLNVDYPLDDNPCEP